MSLQSEIQEILNDESLSYDAKDAMLAKLVTKQDLAALLMKKGGQLPPSENTFSQLVSLRQGEAV